MLKGGSITKSCTGAKGGEWLFWKEMGRGTGGVLNENSKSDAAKKKMRGEVNQGDYYLKSKRGRKASQR